MIVRKTHPDEAQRVNELFAIAFEQSLQSCPADPENDRAVHWAAFSDAGDMMSTLTVSDFHIQFDGHTCLMGGIGGVATPPQYRRMGGVRGCFEAALPDMYEKGYDFSYLYPFSTAYYRKFGYENCVQKYHAALNLSLWSAPAPKGTLRLAERGNCMATDVRAIDTIWERHFNMMVQHREEDYAWVEKADPAVTQEFTYVWYDAAGTPKAYTTFKLATESDGRNLICSRFCFTDRDGFYGLMGLFKALASDHTYVKFPLPATSAIQYLAPEWSLGAVRWNLQAAGMVRVVHVKNVLKKARYLGSGAVTLEIHDEQIPENNGRFAVTFENGRALSVEQTQAEPDAVMTIAAFSALIAGTCDFEAARHTLPGLEVRKDNPVLGQVFYRKPMYITDYF